MADSDLLIIGAGISGLSMAHYAAAAGWSVRVLEQEHRVGGCLHSHRFTGALDGFWLELGAHSAFNSYGNLLAILESLHALERLRPRAKVGFRLFADGAVRRIPTQLVFSELLLAPFRLLGLIKTGRGIAEYYGHIVGPRNYATVFEPAFSAVVCQPADEFPADALFNPRPRRKDVPRGFTLPGGLQTLADILAGSSGFRVELGRTVNDLQNQGEQFVIRTDGGDYTARALCLATPVAVTTRLLRPGFPKLTEQIMEVETATVETVGVAIPKSRLNLPRVAGLIGRNQPFLSVVSRDTVPDPSYRGFTFHFRPRRLDEAGKRDCIAQVLGLPNDQLVLTNVVSKTNQLPALRVGHVERTQAVDGLLAGSRLALTGNYFTGIAIEDCVVRSRQEFARLQRELETV
ncbi:MAG: FAD-dependent oxidoreductase [Candidatus Competibacteraceae bacterium]|nr:FAD-dependent oxidoreductase [Candidatus Competibacteraceae bacterium]MCP5127175.1 FAD-dependent oxidoreductase [Gammaproteobacteria bacterium]HRX72287.1 FAD-dependent oxidoreductase [Candidatus Competibacteraceae bacterium]